MIAVCLVVLVVALALGVVGIALDSATPFDASTPGYFDRH